MTRTKSTVKKVAPTDEEVVAAFRKQGVVACVLEHLRLSKSDDYQVIIRLPGTPSPVEYFEFQWHANDPFERHDSDQHGRVAYRTLDDYVTATIERLIVQEKKSLEATILHFYRLGKPKEDILKIAIKIVDELDKSVFLPTR